ncbi:MAG: hypothetical protein L6R42_006293 [Xanthoria sp. 1 TBL-2021]|nr:MAG: hypothetical protein L6R42_006293 [Xanthoria sp. 1 TBL-2021]
MSSCCTSGFAWNGTPTGRTTNLNDQDIYVTGSNKDVAILFLHDIFGWTFRNNRLLADHFAQEVNATVYLPDFFGGEVITEDMLFDPEKFKELDLQGFLQRNGKEVRAPSVLGFAGRLKSEMGYKKVGAVGYCWGGWAAFQLGGKGKNLIDALSVAHPTFLTKEEIDDVTVPVQILAPETDPRFTPELKEHANRVIPTLGVEYDYQYFPGLVHGFSCRADENNEKEKRGLERAKNAVSGWFGQMLHGR